MMISNDTIIAHLRERGERMTIQRRLVLDVLCAAGDHLSVHEIQTRVQQGGADLNEPTIYRILQWLKGLGMVSQTDLGHGGIVYELIGERPHHHLVCLVCGAVTEVDDSVVQPLRDRVQDLYGFHPRIDHLALFGVCRACHERGAE
ncbi:MAG: transcriptional repressor [Chloroflexi bacterium]|nr:transcriptional repressor [Chloroflexota bacterium]